jgi:hypothetical protein
MDLTSHFDRGMLSIHLDLLFLRSTIARLHRTPIPGRQLEIPNPERGAENLGLLFPSTLFLWLKELCPPDTGYNNSAHPSKPAKSL